MSEINQTLNLPDPDIIEQLDAEQLIEARRQKLIELNPDYQDVLALESEPLNINIEAEAYREALLRLRINESVKANLLAFATGGDLDHLGDFYGLPRADGEDDESYRQRIRERTKASSTAGSIAHYRSRAIEAAPLAIRDVRIDSPEGGLVRVSVLVRHGFDLDETLAKVEQAVNSDEVRVLTDTVNVVSAETIQVPVAATIVLQNTTPEAVIDELKSGLVKQWEQQAGLGWDVTPSWISAQLQKSGVYEVNILEPTQVIQVGANQHAVIEKLDISLNGRGY
ncbi:Baseplate J-like protein [Vibrio aerogenes CECT 7868]|uniref:Baseplate J-like protein n=1 Tax=Vibrio aerogenes CECT 7868 TaxID=1216006 RepID=A0A1M6B8A1_9VIBR|nr:baseplate J/gp47 family protein [Vibrio aerogenes]SHI44956.1 Baseplate J-like protein [Vibrio aerogenes CECT 7868]